MTVFSPASFHPGLYSSSPFLAPFFHPVRTGKDLAVSDSSRFPPQLVSGQQRSLIETRMAEVMRQQGAITSTQQFMARCKAEDAVELAALVDANIERFVVLFRGELHPQPSPGLGGPAV